MKKRIHFCNIDKFLHVFLVIFAIFAFFSFAFLQPTKSIAIASSSETNTVEIIDLSVTTSDLVITDTSKHYKLTNKNSNLNILIENTLNMECDFYITFSRVELTGTFLMPTIRIIDNGYKTNVFFYLEGTNKISANSNHGVMLLSTSNEEIDENNSRVSVVFATETSGSLELINVFGSAPVLSIKEGLATDFQINTKKSEVDNFLINGAVSEFDEDFNKCTQAEKIRTHLSLKCKENKQHTIRFNTMGYGTIDSISASDGSKIITPPIPTADNLEFYAWYKDNLLSQKWTENDTISEDITLYAGWVKPQEKTTSTDSNTKTILYIVLGAIALLTVVFVSLYLVAYKKGKIKSNFLDKLFKTNIKNSK